MNGNPKLERVEIPRRPLGPTDVHIKIAYCGMCHSDMHKVKLEWGPTPSPCVPGHEVVGHVDAVGAGVTKFKIGDTVGVGCFIGSCGTCPECKDSLIQYCSGKREGGLPGLIETYGAQLSDGTGHSMGGYSQAIVCNEDFVLRIPTNISLAAAAPLLCAGITTYSPMIHYGIKKGHKVAVLGLGGLGHMAVKFGKAMGCEVTVLTRSSGKEETAKGLGASKVLITTNKDALTAANRTFDFIIDTVSAKHDINAITSLLKTDGTLIIVGGVPEYLDLSTFSLILRRIKIGGSLVGGIKETQEMLDFCGKHNIISDIELISADYANKAFERMLASDVKYRFVIDIGKTLSESTVVA